MSRVAAACAAAVVALAVVVLASWALGAPTRVGMLRGAFVMLPNTAVVQLLAAVGVLSGRRGVRLATGLVVLAFGATVLFEHVANVPLGIDLLLFPDGVRRFSAGAGLLVPGRVALNSALCFTLAGATLLALDVEPARGRWPAEWSGLAGLAIAWIALIGYLYGARPLYAIDRVVGMALSTAVGFAMLFSALLASRGTRGVVSLVVGPDLGAVLARRLLPAVLLLPPALGWLWLRGREQALVGREGGVALFVAATMGTLGVIVLLGARAVRLVDRSRHRAFEREATARAAAESASRAKSDFLAVMSHELRTPLNAILGYVALLDEGISGPVTDLQRAQLGRVRASARHLVGLIDEILTLSRIEAGRETVRRELVDVAAALDDAAAMAAPQAAGKGLAFVVRAPDTPTTIDTDAAKLRQILLNLLSNAVKFTDAGEVRLRAAATGDGFEFEVHDTGIGIAPEHVERIFEPFWQVEQRTAHRAAGTGLGLDVSRRLAHLLGGELRVTSAPGAGSTFTLRLPASSVERQAPTVREEAFDARRSALDARRSV